MRIEEVIGQRVKAAREAAGMSLKEVGVAVGEYLDRAWTAQAVWQAEHGQRDFKAAHLLALALVLEIPVVQLLAPLSAGESIDIDSHTITEDESQRLFMAVASPGAAALFLELDRRLTAIADRLRMGAEQQRELVREIDEVGMSLNGLVDEAALSPRMLQRHREATARRSEERDR